MIENNMSSENRAASNAVPEVIDIFTGEVYRPGFLSVEKKRFWGLGALKKDGSPRANNRGHLLGIYRSSNGDGSEPYHFNGDYILVSKDDAKGAELRAAYLAAEKAVKDAKLAVLRHYNEISPA